MKFWNKLLIKIVLKKKKFYSKYLENVYAQ